MRGAYDVATVRAAEAAALAGLPEGALMQRAAAGVARRCAAALGHLYGTAVAVLAGTGDNGGDALFAGARLAARGARVSAVAVGGERVHDGGLQALRAAGGRLVPAAAGSAAVAGADLVVDGILGIGGRGGLRPDAAALVAAIGSARGPDSEPPVIVAVDLPSGVDASTGRVDGAAVRADVTVTFGALKPGLLVAPGAWHCGLVELVDIGLSGHLPASIVGMLDADDVAARLPVAGPEADKYRRGVVGVVAGSVGYPGAAVLAVGGALAAGAGMVRFVGPAPVATRVLAAWPEALVTEAVRDDAAARLAAVGAAGRVQAWVLGPGLDPQVAGELLAGLVGASVPLLVDAGALGAVAASGGALLRPRHAPTLLTPHAGEFARLTGASREEVEADRLERVRAAAAELGVTVLLKGSTTLVADPGGGVLVNPTGTAALATAGSGDVLAGAAGALLAAGCTALDAGALAAFLHGLAGRAAAAGGVPIRSGLLIEHWAAAVRAVRTRTDDGGGRRRGGV